MLKHRFLAKSSVSFGYFRISSVSLQLHQLRMSIVSAPTLYPILVFFGHDDGGGNRPVCFSLALHKPTYDITNFHPSIYIYIYIVYGGNTGQNRSKNCNIYLNPARMFVFKWHFSFTCRLKRYIESKPVCWVSKLLLFKSSHWIDYAVNPHFWTSVPSCRLCYHCFFPEWTLSELRF